MLAEIYTDALLFDEKAADQVCEAWGAGHILEFIYPPLVQTAVGFPVS